MIEYRICIGGLYDVTSHDALALASGGDRTSNGIYIALDEDGVPRR